eukprot:3514168-Pyramimonas_sp.AAC.1
MQGDDGEGKEEGKREKGGQQEQSSSHLSANAHAQPHAHNLPTGLSRQKSPDKQTLHHWQGDRDLVTRRG